MVISFFAFLFIIGLYCVFKKSVKATAESINDSVPEVVSNVGISTVAGSDALANASVKWSMESIMNSNESLPELKQKLNCTDDSVNSITKLYAWYRKNSK